MTSVPAAVNPFPSTVGVEDLLARGDVVAARRELDAIAERVGTAARPAHDVAQLYMRLGDAGRAADFYARAVAIEPGSTAYRYNLSTALIALGRMDEAETALDSVIAAQPQDCDAWYNRATLRRQTHGRNHIDAIERELRHPGLRPQHQVPLYYALAKELEDLGEFESSFAALTRGAGVRRSLLSYRVEDDVAIMQEIRATFTRDWIDAQAPACNDSRPVFVVGLPRSGTTLVDRMLSSHSAVGSRGESADLALSLTRTTGPCRNKAELLDRSSRLDGRALGAAYCATLAAYSGERVVDKTPANFLYLGLVARALPKAHIIYVRRRPMDVCYAMYKTLFRMAYPYSYDLGDLGRYWLAFDGLMRHWQHALPVGRMLVVDYEELVTDPEPSVRAMLDHIGMPWQNRCLRFNENPLPSLTASAAQVRQPLYRTSIESWRHHASGLAPLMRRLREASVVIDDTLATGVP